MSNVYDELETSNSTFASVHHNRSHNTDRRAGRYTYRSHNTDRRAGIYTWINAEKDFDKEYIYFVDPLKLPSAFWRTSGSAYENVRNLIFLNKIRNRLYTKQH